MKRREFITLVGAAALAGPVDARARQPDRMRRVGVLMLSATTANALRPTISSSLLARADEVIE